MVYSIGMQFIGPQQSRRLVHQRSSSKRISIPVRATPPNGNEARPPRKAKRTPKAKPSPLQAPAEPVEQPVVKEPVMEQPVMKEPVIEEPVVEAPVIEEPVLEQPVVIEPVMEEPPIMEQQVQPPVAQGTPQPPQQNAEQQDSEPPQSPATIEPPAAEGAAVAVDAKAACTAFYDAFNKKNWQALADTFADDITYTDYTMDTIVGKEAVVLHCKLSGLLFQDARFEYESFTEGSGNKVGIKWAAVNTPFGTLRGLSFNYTNDAGKIVAINDLMETVQWGDVVDNVTQTVVPIAKNAAPFIQQIQQAFPNLAQPPTQDTMEQGDYASDEDPVSLVKNLYQALNRREMTMVQSLLSGDFVYENYDYQTVKLSGQKAYSAFKAQSLEPFENAKMTLLDYTEGSGSTVAALWRMDLNSAVPLPINSFTGITYYTVEGGKITYAIEIAEPPTRIGNILPAIAPAVVGVSDTVGPAVEDAQMVLEPFIQNAQATVQQVLGRR